MLTQEEFRTRVTIKDIAARLNITPNTVSKALNNKGQISEKTRKRILEVAEEMHYVPNEAAKRLVRKELHIAVVYPLEPHEFYAYILQGIRKAEDELAGFKCRIHHFPYASLETPDEVRDRLREVMQFPFDGLVITCSHRCDSYVEELTQFGEKHPILYNTIFGPEVPGCLGGVRMNTHLAGRMAAEFLHLTLGKERKKVALFVGEKNLLVHRECIEGFCGEMENFGIELAGIWETYEDRERIYELTGEVMARHPDLDGIYVTSASSPAVCRWMREHAPRKKPLIIGHDLYPELNRTLRERVLDASLFQNQYEYGRESVQMLYEYLTGARSRDNCFKRMTPQIILSSMVDAFPYYD